MKNHLESPNTSSKSGLNKSPHKSSTSYKTKYKHPTNHLFFSHHTVIVGKCFTFVSSIIAQDIQIRSKRHVEAKMLSDRHFKEKILGSLRRPRARKNNKKRYKIRFSQVFPDFVFSTFRHFSKKMIPCGLSVQNPIAKMVVY